MELPLDRRDGPVVDVDVGGAADGTSAAAVQAPHDLVEQQRQRPAVCGAVPAEVEATEHHATTDGQRAPLVGHEWKQQRVAAAGQVESGADGCGVLVDHPSL